jgi:hypothetical protein
MAEPQINAGIARWFPQNRAELVHSTDDVLNYWAFPTVSAMTAPRAPSGFSP